MKIVSNGKTLAVPSCTSQDIYSTEEQVVGRWIDGKPLYRKSAQFITPSTAICRVDSAISEDIEEVISYFGIVSAKNETKYTFPSPYIVLEHTSTAGWFLNVLDADQRNSPITLTMEYTKTTDQATIGLPAALTAAPAQAACEAASQSAAAVTLDAGIKTEEV